MKKIVLMCAGGMSSSTVAKKIEKEIKKRNLNFSVGFYPTMAWNVEDIKADFVLLAPQVSYQLDELKRKLSCPIIPIKPLDYGRARVENILNYILKNLI